MDSSFTLDGANNNDDYEFEFDNIDNLSGPTNLSFISNTSNNGLATIHVITAKRRLDPKHHTVCIASSNKICTQKEANHINSTKTIEPTHKRSC